MGTDKALLEVGGVPLASRTAGVLRAAGAGDVRAIGGDGPRLQALGLDWLPDPYPGEGPLGGIIAALGAAAADIVVVVATDLVALTAVTVGAVVAALDHSPDADVAVADSGRLEPLCGAWRRRAEPPVRVVFEAGERAVHAALGALTVVTVPVDPDTLRNVNAPADL